MLLMKFDFFNKKLLPPSSFSLSVVTKDWYLIHDNIYHLCVCVCVCTQTLFNLKDYSPPGSSAHGISQEKILEWVVISSSRGTSWSRDQTHVSCIGRPILYHWAIIEAFIISDTNQLDIKKYFFPKIIE